MDRFHLVFFFFFFWDLGICHDASEKKKGWGGGVGSLAGLELADPGEGRASRRPFALRAAAAVVAAGCPLRADEPQELRLARGGGGGVAAVVARRGRLGPAWGRPSSAKAEHQVEGGLLLDVVVGEGAPVLQLLAGEDEPLLVGRDALIVLFVPSADVSS